MSTRSHLPTVSADRGLPTGFLDDLRGLAAAYVMIGHARGLLWEGFSNGYVKHPEQYSWFGKMVVYCSSFFRFGHEAVLFFFVLSGFVIHLRYARRIQNDGPLAKFGWRDFVYRRARRLFPPLLAAIVITFIVDRIGMSQDYSIYRLETSNPAINRNFKSVPHHDWVTLLGNLSFLCDTDLHAWGTGSYYMPAWGTDAPLWSLKFEWWFYMIYPLFWWMSKKSQWLAGGVMLLLYVLSSFHEIWPFSLLQVIFSAMLLWWFGAILADMYTRRLSMSWKSLSPLLVCLPAAVINGDDRFAPGSLLWGLGFAGLIATCFAMQQRGWRLRILERMHALGDMSYTLYVIHLPILVLMSGWLMSRSPDGTLPRHFWWAGAGIATSLVIAWFTHLLVERPFNSRTKTTVTASPATT